MVLYLFLSHLGVGIAVTLVLVARGAGLKFFRFNAGLAAILISGSLLFRYDGAAVGLLVASEVALLVYWATVGRVAGRARPFLLAAAVSAGLLAIVSQAFALSTGDSVPLRLLTAASFLSSAAFLGSSCTAMLLGHWYLVIPSLEITHLQSVVRFHIASMIVRMTVVGAAVFAGLALSEAGPAARVINFREYVLSIDGIFFWQRVLFGLAGPAILSYLTWETAKIRSTQSATGILYVDFFAVIVGEALAKYLTLATRVPF